MTLEEAFNVIGLTPPPLADARSYDEASKRLSEWKGGPLRDRFRALLREWHPDRGAQADADERNARTAEIIAAHDAIRLKFEVKRRRHPLRQGRVVVVRMGG